MTDIIVKQLESFSQHDFEGFMACYHDSIEVYMLQTGHPLAKGIDQLRDVMKSSFEDDSPETTTEVISSIVQGNLVVNHEKITGHIDGKVIYTISIYELTEGLISKLWFGGRTTEDNTKGATN